MNLLPHDDDLFNLHSKTYVGIVRGPERAQILAPPVSRNAMPMVRPDPRPTMLYGRGRNTRKHRTGIPVGQSRTATYRIPAGKLRPGETYDIQARLRSCRRGWGAFIELGRGINEVGELSPGIEMPAGAVWQPAFWAYGTARVAGLATDGNRRTIPGGDSAEVMARMDLFANLQLTGTERVHAHFRPLDQRGGFAGRVLSPKESSTTFDIDLDADVGLGGYRPALWPRPLDSAGFALGVQKFFADEAANWVVEFAHRRDLEDDDEFGNTGGVAVTTRFQRKFFNRFPVQVDACQAWHESDNGRPQDGENDDDSAAVRVESRMNF